MNRARIAKAVAAGLERVERNAPSSLQLELDRFNAAVRARGVPPWFRQDMHDGPRGWQLANRSQEEARRRGQMLRDEANRRHWGRS